MSESAAPAAPEATPALGVSANASEQAAPADTNADSAPADNLADDAGAEPSQPKARGVQKRIDELTARAYQAERRADEVLRMLQAQLQPSQPQPNGQPGQPAPIPPVVAAQIGPAPKPEDFAGGEWDPAYSKAVARYEARAELAQHAIRAQHHAQVVQLQQTQAKLHNDLQQLEQATPGAMAAVQSLGMRLPNWAANTLAEAGAEIAHFVATNPEAEARIAQARTPAAVERVIGSIEARLEAARAAPPKPTNAPPPPQRTRGSAPATGEPDINNTEAWIAWRRQQKYGR